MMIPTPTHQLVFCLAEPANGDISLGRGIRMNTDLTAGEDPAEMLENTVCHLINLDRYRRHVEWIDFDADLQRVARIRAKEESAFRQSRLDAANRLEIDALVVGAAGRYIWYAEHIAHVHGHDQLAAARLYRALMTRPPHRQAILEPLFNG